MRKAKGIELALESIYQWGRRRMSEKIQGLVTVRELPEGPGSSDRISSTAGVDHAIRKQRRPAPVSRKAHSLAVGNRLAREHVGDDRRRIIEEERFSLR
jgi:hypothetical protein